MPPQYPEEEQNVYLTAETWGVLTQHPLYCFTFFDMEKQVNGVVHLRQVPQNRSIIKKDKKTPYFAITDHLIF